jgi:hypothetical protein
MRFLCARTVTRVCAATALLLSGVALAQADSVSMQIIADNDFALFSGTDTKITRLIYQNGVSWPDQLNELLTFSFGLQPGETTLYLLGMGGGGSEENISGTVNGVDITSIPVSMSSDIAPNLTGYLDNIDTVADATYNASVPDVKQAFPSLTWGAPAYTNSQGVVEQSPTGQGYYFATDTAHLFAFSAASVNVPTSTPEPAS